MPAACMLSRAFGLMLLLWSAAAPVAYAARPPVAAFSRGADLFAPSISPDGSAIVHLSHTDDGHRYVAVRLIGGDGGTAILRGEAGQRDNYLATYCWFKTDQRILCHFHGIEFEAGRPYPTSRIVALNRDGSGVKVLMQRESVRGSQFQDRIVSRLPSDPTGVLVALDGDEDVYPSVFRLDVVTGQLTEVVRQRKPIMRWIADRDGVVRFGYGFEGKKGQYLARDSADSEWRTLLKFDRFDPDRFGVLGFAALPGRMLVSSDHNGREAIFEMDLSDRSDLELVFSHPEVDIDGAYVWPGTDRVIGFAYETDRPQLQMIDPAASGLQTSIDKLLPGSVNRMIDAARNGRRIIVYSSSDNRSGIYYLLDLDQRSIKPLGAESPALAKAELATMQPIKVPATDGTPMPGYLTLPPGVTTARGLPAVVLPHGGPYVRDSWGYDPLVQMLATRGYAVLQVNYRGSTGYGDAWLKAGFQGWGTVMHDDITAAARWLGAQGIADPGRICIVGWSYGGYAALIGAVKEPGLYRCAASIAGVSDLRAILDEDSRFYGGRADAEQSIGKVDYASLSPRRRAAEIKVPVLLVHGHADYTVVATHSKEMAEALKRAGKPYELLVLKDGDHSLVRPAHRQAAFEKLASFLEANLGGTPQAAPTKVAATSR